MQHRFTITAEEAGGRLDAVLAARDLGGLSRSRLKALIEEGNLHSARGDSITNAAHKVRGGEEYLLTIPPLRPAKLVGKAIPLTILYEDEHLLVINKQAGLTVHPAPGNEEDTLVHALLAHCGATLSGIGGDARPGIVHRLDKDTSGLMVAAKHDAAHQGLAAQLADRSLSRQYVALVWGTLAASSGRIDAAIGRSPANRKKMAVVTKGGKSAVTHYTTRQRFLSQPTTSKPGIAVVSLVECKLETGRTHQIRVHLAHLAHPLVGDPTYGGRVSARLAALSDTQLPPEVREALANFPRQALHAEAIRFIHPVSGENLSFRCNLPPDMDELLSKCASSLVISE